MTQTHSRPPPRLQAPFALADHFDVLIVGSGVNAAQVASLLRQAGFEGSVAIVSDDAGADEAALMRASVARVEWIANHRVVAVDFDARLAFEAHGVALAYLKLIYAPELGETPATRSTGWAVLITASAATQEGVPVDRCGRSTIDHVYAVGSAAILARETDERLLSAGVTARDVVADLMTSLATNS